MDRISNNQLEKARSMSALIYKLTVVHGKLDDAIRHEHKRRLPDGIRLLRLKKLRIAVKDRLQLLVRFGRQERV